VLAGNGKTCAHVVLRATVVGGQRKNQTLKGESDAAARILPFKSVRENAQRNYIKFSVFFKNSIDKMPSQGV